MLHCIVLYYCQVSGTGLEVTHIAINWVKAKQTVYTRYFYVSVDSDCHLTVIPFI